MPPSATQARALAASAATSASDRYMSSQLENKQSVSPAGRSSSVASPQRKSTLAQSALALAFWSMSVCMKSMATTDAAAWASGRVKRPMPAPSSTTRWPATSPRKVRTWGERTGVGRRRATRLRLRPPTSQRRSVCITQTSAHADRGRRCGGDRGPGGGGGGGNWVALRPRWRPRGGRMCPPPVPLGHHSFDRPPGGVDRQPRTPTAALRAHFVARAPPIPPLSDLWPLKLVDLGGLGVEHHLLDGGGLRVFHPELAHRVALGCGFGGGRIRHAGVRPRRGVAGRGRAAESRGFPVWWQPASDGTDSCRRRRLAPACRPPHRTPPRWRRIGMSCARPRRVRDWGHWGEKREGAAAAAAGGR